MLVIPLCGAGVDVMSRGYSDVVCCVVVCGDVLPRKVKWNGYGIGIGIGIRSYRIMSSCVVLFCVMLCFIGPYDDE